MKHLFVALFFLFLNSISFHVVSADDTKAIDVDAIQAEGDKASQTLILTGSVEAKQHAALALQQSGLVSAIAAEAGDVVKKGQLLLSLDAKLAQLQLAQSQASKTSAIAKKNEAERLYQEVTELSKKQLVAKTLMAERLSALEVANAELVKVNAEIAQQQEVVARHQLYAPFAGVIATRGVNLGEWVTQATAAFTLVETDSLRVKVAIPQEYLMMLHGKSAVAASVIPDFAGSSVRENSKGENAISTAITATLDRIVPVANASHRAIDAFISLPRNSSLMAGMSVRVEIALPSSEQAFIWLPKSAIKQHPDGGKSIFTVENNRAKRVLVNVLKEDGNNIAVTGAKPEQLYILTGIELLNDGDLVNATRVKARKDKATSIKGDSL